jgi:hypothetical protein
VLAHLGEPLKTLDCLLDAEPNAEQFGGVPDRLAKPAKAFLTVLAGFAQTADCLGAAPRQAGVRARMTEAVQLADRLVKEAETLRRQLADHQALQAEHQALKANVAEVERRHAGELARAAERAARQDKEAAEAGAAEKTALERPARAEGQVEALKNQLAGLTALLQPGAKGSHRGGGKEGD